MLKKREDLIRVLKEKCKSCISDRRQITNHCNMMETMYGIPKNISADMFMLVADYESFDDFTLFAQASVFDISTGGRIVNTFFTENEVETYKKTKYEKSSVKFPIVLKMQQVSNDQWVGTISMKQIMSFRDASLIYYNENTQRSMQRKTASGIEYYTITIYKNKVNQIKECMLNEQYIPDAITLNMPEDTVYSYNGSELIISDIKAFDIIDGYHRYVAMSQININNPSFDFIMELRITRFDEGKAKQFIWQQDQHTKMKKVDSTSMKQDLEANKIVASLTSDNSFCMYGMIKRNGGVISETDMSAAINLCFYTNRESLSAQEKVIKRMEIQKQIKKYFQIIIENDISVINDRWNFAYLLSVIICISERVPEDVFIKQVEKTYSLIDRKTTASSMNRRMLNIIKEKSNV